MCFSSDEEETIRREVSTDNICLQPPSGFSDSRELSETECDREMKPRKLSVELANLLERYVILSFVRKLPDTSIDGY